MSLSHGLSTPIEEKSLADFRSYKFFIDPYDLSDSKIIHKDKSDHLIIDPYYDYSKGYASSDVVILNQKFLNSRPAGILAYDVDETLLNSEKSKQSFRTKPVLINANKVRRLW